MPPTTVTPDGAIALRTYRALDEYVQAFARAKLNLLWIIGRPGIQKSQAIRSAVGRGACWIDGNATACELYRELYRHRDQLAPLEIHLRCEDLAVFGMHHVVEPLGTNPQRHHAEYFTPHILRFPNGPPVAELEPPYPLSHLPAAMKEDA